MSELDELRKKFPARFYKLGFPCPPVDAQPQTKRAYRLCNSEKTLEKNDFLPTYVERRHFDENSVTSYSVSFLEDADSVKKWQKKWPNLKNKRAVEGVIKKKYGFMNQKPNDPHCNLWLYDGAEPWIDFETEELTESE